jgi:TPR repeat protein
MNPDDKTQTAQQEEAAAFIREAIETLAEKKEPMSDDDSAQEEWTEFKHYAEAEAYFNGDDREKNPQLAAKHFRIAAEKGYAKAQHKLGVCYALGNGVEQNDKLAVAWYQKAAAQGFAEAEYNLGVRYVLGKGVDKDPVKGRELYRRAAENGYEPAVNALKKFNN